ncbi:SMI1/KNR4 family protein [Cytobacillus gottheilii]|uniref:SMI1/KNR4 family protein n=1 Tax=Cytobacillus gottheilii TaxID=859144 RepID=UPI00249523A0|nr:SMI1/KNR4 family protein [Cytobacillus gottheilii]
MKIWKNSYDVHVVLEPLTKDDIELAENIFNVHLPENYINLLYIQNGGYLVSNYVRVNFDTDWGENIAYIDSLNGIKKDRGIMETNSLLAEWGVENKNYIIISGDGHYFIVLDYSKGNKDPFVSHIDTETNVINIMFTSFDEFIFELTKSTGDEDDSNEYHNQLVFDFSQNPSLEFAKVLVNSNDEEAIYQGIKYWEQTNKDQQELYDILLKQIQNPSFSSIQGLAIQTFWSKIMSNKIRDIKLIKKILVTIPDSSFNEINSAKSDIKNVLNEIINSN